MATKIVHEASTQRQFVRLKLPIRVHIGDADYEVADWSVAGLGVIGLTPVPALDQTLPVTLHFDFNGFTFELKAVTRVRHTGSETVGLEFVDLEPEQLELLHYLIGAFMSGEMVSAGDLLAISKRQNFTGVRMTGKAAPRRGLVVVQRVLLLGFLWVVALTLVGVIVTSAFERWFVVAADGVLSSPDARTVYAPGEGTITAINSRPGTPVQPGQLLLTLNSTTETFRPVTSSCVCIVGQTFVEIGGFVRKGAPLLSLSSASGRLSADFLVPLATAQRVKAGDDVEVTLYGERGSASAKVDRVVLPTFTETNAFGRLGLAALQLSAVVRVRFDERLPISRVGQPASAKISTFRLFS